MLRAIVLSRPIGRGITIPAGPVWETMQFTAVLLSRFTGYDEIRAEILPLWAFCGANLNNLQEFFDFFQNFPILPLTKDRDSVRISKSVAVFRVFQRGLLGQLPS